MISSDYSSSSDVEYCDDYVPNPLGVYFVRHVLLSFFKKDIMDICKTHRLSMVQLRYLYKLRWSSDVNLNELCLYPVWNVIHRKHPRNDVLHDFRTRQLINGQGAAGKASATNHPWFSTDISSIPKTDYPLSGHAKELGFRSAVAIPFLHTTRSGKQYSYVFEFFLPSDCTDLVEQMKIVTALTSTVLPQSSKKYVDRLIGVGGFMLEPLKLIEQSGPSDALFPNENPREATDGIRLSLEPGDQNEKDLVGIEVGDTVGPGSCLRPAVNEISEQRQAIGDKAINSSTGVNNITKRTGDLAEQMRIVTALISTVLQLPQFRGYFSKNPFVLKALKVIEQSGPNDSLFRNENPREASDGIRLSQEPGDQNEKDLVGVDQTEVGDTVGPCSCLRPAGNEISEQRHATGDKAINTSTSVNNAAKSTGGKRTRGGGSKRDWAWKYCSIIEGNSNGTICSFCGLEIKGGGITRFKSHISAGEDPSKNVMKCKELSPEKKAEIEAEREKRIKRG